MTFSYDSDADVLYVTFERSLHPAQYIENDNGDILRIDEQSGKIVGCTILFFLQRAKTGTISVPEIGVVPFNQIANNLLNERKQGKSQH
jgi:uncharacterized protein YuzE